LSVVREEARPVQDWREHREKVMQAGNIIAEAVALPSFTPETVPKQPPRNSIAERTSEWQIIKGGIGHQSSRIS
jgi:hypothetical protein